MYQQFISRATATAPYHRHIKRVALALLFSLIAATVLAEIKIPAQTPVGKKIEAELMASIPVGAEVQGGWVILDCDTDLESPTKIQIWATPGKHEIKFQGAWMQFELVPIPQPDGTTKMVKSNVAWGFINESATFEVTGGDGPVPPPPPPPPVPGGPYQIVLFYSPDQLDNLTADQREILNSMAYREKLKAAGHTLLGVLPDNAAPSPQSKFRAFYNMVQGDPMPRLAVASKDGGKIVDMPLPATVEELDSLLKTEVLK